VLAARAPPPAMRTRMADHFLHRELPQKAEVIGQRLFADRRLQSQSNGF